MSSEESNENEPLPLKRVEWRLPVMMAERHIRTATALHRQLVPYGIDITSDRISRIVAKMPNRMTMEVLIGLMTVLECSASDLIREMPDEPKTRHSATPVGADAKPAASAPRKAKQAARAKDDKTQQQLDSTVGAMLGTKVEPIPIRSKDKR